MRSFTEIAETKFDRVQPLSTPEPTCIVENTCFALIFDVCFYAGSLLSGIRSFEFRFQWILSDKRTATLPIEMQHHMLPYSQPHTRAATNLTRRLYFRSR